MTNTLPDVAALPRRVKRPVTQAQVDGDACMLCGNDFERLHDRVPFGAGYRCDDRATCAQERAKLYPQKASGDAQNVRPEEGHDAG